MNNLDYNKNDITQVSSPKISYNFISIICIAIAILARLFTPGWFWFVIGVLGPIHALLFFFSNYNVSKFVNKSSLANLVFWLSCITFTIVYVFLPDFSDTSSYSIFGLIQDSSVLNILYMIVRYSLFANIILIILGFFMGKIINYKKNCQKVKLEDNTDKISEKNYSIIKKLSIFILAFCILSFILNIFFGSIKALLLFSISIVLMIFTIIFCSKKIIYGTITALISAILIFFVPSILYKILSITLLVCCIKTIIYEKNT